MAHQDQEVLEVPEVTDQVDQEGMDHPAQEVLEVLFFWEFPSTLEQVILSLFHLLEASLLFLEVPSDQTLAADLQSLLPSMEHLTLQQA